MLKSRLLVILLLSSPALADVALLPAGSTRVIGNDGGYIVPVSLTDANGEDATVVADGHLQVSQDTLYIADRAVGTTLNTNVWTGNTTTQTIDTLNGFYRLNASGITTLSTTSQLQTIKLHAVGFTDIITAGRAVVKTNNLPLTNSTAQLGFFNATGTTILPTDGCYFEWNALAEFRAVATNTSISSQSGVLTNPSSNIIHVFAVVMRAGECRFSIDDVQVALLSFKNVNGTQPSLVTKLPFAARYVTSPTGPASIASFGVAAVTTYMAAVNYNQPASAQLASAGRASYQSPTTTYTQTANHANSTSPASASLSNTAAGYTTLGGRWQFAAVASAATDFALFAYQVPAGHQLRVNAIQISACNTVATVATTPTLLDWSVAVNSNAVSLATADALGPPPTAWGPRRIALGLHGFVVGALAGACVPAIIQNFTTPLVVDGGRFFHVIVQVPVGTATATEIFRGDVTVIGEFEW